MKKVILFCLLVIGISFSFQSCDTEAYVASQNVSAAADNFEVFRRVTFINGITGDQILVIEGYCSVEFESEKFVVTVKTGPGTYLKHYLGKADNVFPCVQQLEPSEANGRQYRMILRPSTLIPDIEFR